MATQREVMRDLFRKYRTKEATCAAYAKAERDGAVLRRKNSYGISPEAYADALWRDGERRGWLNA